MFSFFTLKWADNSNFFELFAAIMFLNVVVSGLYLICEPGARTTTEFEMFEEELRKCEWYLLPIEMQRMYTILLSDTQNPIQMCSYGGIVCNRDTLKRVLISIVDEF